MEGENLEEERREKELARQRFLALKMVLGYLKKGQYTEKTVLMYFAGFCGHVPTEEDLRFEREEVKTVET